jgi:hypothetical protein
MTIDVETLATAVRGNDPAAVVDVLRGASEQDRARGLREVTKLLGISSLTNFMGIYPKTELINSALMLAGYGLVSGRKAALSVTDLHLVPPRTPIPTGNSRGPASDLLEEVLADRRPPWLPDLVDAMLEGSYGGGGWHLTRGLFRLGVLERPTSSGYTITMIWSLKYSRRGGHAGISAALLADPSLLEDEIWRLFTVRDAGFAIQRADGLRGSSGGESWAEALATLAEHGHVDRGRLIDESLAAFNRGFAANRVGWYAELLDRLAPSSNEVFERIESYLSLLAAEAKPALAVGQRAARGLIQEGRIDSGLFLSRSEVALGHPQKSVVLDQLRLIGELMARDPAIVRTATAALETALEHPRSDIQDAARKLIDKYRRDDVSGTSAPFKTARVSGSLRDHRTAAPPEADASIPERTSLAVRERIGKLAVAIEDPMIRSVLESAENGIPAPPPHVGAGPGVRLPPPIDSPEELVGAFTILMEDASDALLVERVLAGAVRLSALPEKLRSVVGGATVKRALTRGSAGRGPFSGREIAADVACVALAWASGWDGQDEDWTRRPDFWSRQQERRPPDAAPLPQPNSVDVEGRPTSMAGLLSARALECVRIINTRRRVELLAEPAFDRGGVDPEDLLRRLSTWSQGAPARDPEPLDVEAAVLRLPPGLEEDFWRDWTRLVPHIAASARDSYSVARRPVPLGVVIGLPHGYRPLRGWRWKLHVLARVTESGAPANRGSRSWQLLTALTDPLRDHVKLAGSNWYNTHYAPIVAGWPLLAPWQPELVAAHLLRPLSDGLEPGPSAATAAVLALAHRDFVLGPIGHVALVAGLASAEADTRIAAAHVLTEAANDGRLRPQLAAEALVVGVGGGVFKLTRVASALQHTSRSALAAYRTIEIVFDAADQLVRIRPPNLHLLFDLAARFGAVVGRPALPSSIGEVAARKGSSQLLVTARRVREVDSVAAPQHEDVIVESVEAFLQRR